MEKWKWIKGFEGSYQISSYGHLKSFKQFAEGRILSNRNKKGGYISVVLQHKGRKRSTRIHRLVAETFIANPEQKREVNHIDGNVQNNHIRNLEWVTPKENIRHAVRIKPNMVAGMNRYNRFIKPKTICQLNLSGKIIAEFPNSVEAGKSTGVCHRNILQVASRDEYQPGKTRKQAGGFIWKYKEIRKGKK